MRNYWIAKLHNTSFLGIIFGFIYVLLTPTLVIAQSDSAEALLNQYVISGVARIAPLQAQALEDVQGAAQNKEFDILGSSGSTILIGDFASNGEVSDAPKIPLEYADVCDRLRKQTRDELRERIDNGQSRSVRRYICDPNGTFTASYTPNDPMYASQWGFTEQSNNIDMNMTAAWDITRGSDSTVVAVIDTGVNYNHVDLRDNIWTNPGEIPGNGKRRRWQRICRRRPWNQCHYRQRRSDG